MLRRSCLARFPKTKSMASITLDLPLPFGPTTEENLCTSNKSVQPQCSTASSTVPYIQRALGPSPLRFERRDRSHSRTAGRWARGPWAAAVLRETNSCAPTQVLAVALGKNIRDLRQNTLWNGPICCTPAYDLKFSSVMCVIISRVRGSAAFSAPSAILLRLTSPSEGRCRLNNI